MKLKYILSILLGLVLFFLFKSSIIYSQECDFRCGWMTDDCGGPDCCVQQISCEPSCPIEALTPGSSEEIYCNGFLFAPDCNYATGHCQTCDWPGSVCHIPEGGRPCPDGYSYQLDYSCANPNANCCYPSNLPTPTPALCYQCVIEGLGENYCGLVAPPQPGNCYPFFGSEGDCNAHCQNPVRYNCINGEYICTPADETGDYGSLSECEEPCLNSRRECSGYQNNYPGECYFLLNCPPEMSWGGINLPAWVPIPSSYPTNWPKPGEYTECTSFESCCLLVTPTINPMPTIEPVCTTENGESGIYTAIGCVAVSSQNGFLEFILPWALGVGGGTAFILIIIGGFLFMTSAGDPQRVKAARELLTSAVIGLLMIIFSVYILNLIGVRILNLPGL